MSTVIKVENLSKRYRLGVINRDMLYKDLQSRWAKFRGKEDPNATIGLKHDKRLEHGDEFWALRNVDLEVKEGEVLGIIGGNGAGKSTLLKIFSQITSPTEGKIKVKGRIASLLEVGTGFHPELTGRENVYLNGAILGMTRKEVMSKFDEIVSFAGIDEFIDTPVKRYSSGMYVRLAFAVAAHLEPEILIVDEVLAVGDAAFQKKCLGRMKYVAKHGRTVIFVSHSMPTVKSLCERVAYLDQGVVVANGDPASTIDCYLDATLRSGATGSSFAFEQEDKAFQVLRARIKDTSGEDRSNYECDESFSIELMVKVNDPTPGLYGYLGIVKNDGTIVLEGDSIDSGQNVLDGLSKGLHVICIEIPPRLLAPGSYFVCISFASPHSVEAYTVEESKRSLILTLQDSRTRRGASRGGFLSTILPWKLQTPQLHS